MEVDKVPEAELNKTKIMNELQHEFNKEDELLFRKCKAFCDLNISADQLGAPSQFSLDFLPAITELANLDSYNSSVDKLNCICTTLDLIYADLKYFLIKIFCLNSDSELQIPIVEENDVSAIILFVIIKAKPLHLKSNISIISNSTEYGENKQEILKKFKNAVDQLFVLSESFLKPPCEEGLITDLDFKKFITLAKEKLDDENISTPLQLRNYEALKLILAATNI